MLLAGSSRKQFGNIASPGGPASITGLQAWYDASAPNSVYSDGAAHFTAASLQRLAGSDTGMPTGTASRSFTTWAKLDATGGTQAFFSYGTGGATQLFAVAKDGSDKVYVSQFGASVVSNTAITTAWAHVVVTYDGTTYTIYLNGVSDKTGTMTTNTVLNGSVYLGFDSVNYLTGSMDSTGFYPGVFSAADIAELYAAGAGATWDQLSSGLQAKFNTAGGFFYDLNEETGTRYDASSNNRDLTASTNVIISGATLNGNFETLGAGETLGAELVQNPGFETAGAGGADVFGSWTEVVNGTSTVNDEAVDFDAGAHACRLDIDGSNSQAGVTQTILTSGHRYRYSLRCKVSDATGSPQILLQIGSGFAPAISPTTSYVTYTGTFFADGTVFGLYRHLNCDSKSIYFDSVSIKRITADDVFANWTEVADGDATLSDEGTVVDTGSHAAKLVSGSTGADNVGIEQTSRTVVGDRYLATIRARGGSGGEGLVIGGATAGLYTTFTLTNAYATYSHTFTATQTSFGFRRFTSSATHYIDNVTLTDLGPVGIGGIAAGLATDGNFCGRFVTGSNQTLSVANTSSLNPYQSVYSVAGCFYFDDINAAYGIVGKTNQFGIGTNGSILYFRVIDGLGSNVDTVSTVAPVAGNFFFFAAIIDTTNHVAKFQINEETMITTALTNDVQNSTGAFIIGNNTNNFVPLNGRADCIGVWKGHALTAGEITALFNNGKGLKQAGLAAAGVTAATSYYDMDKKAGITADSAGSNTLTNNNAVTYAQGVNYYEGVVAKWLDRSGNARHLLQATNSKRPAYLTSVQNGKPVLRFDGVDDFLQKTFTLAQPFTLFIVFKSITWTDLNYVVDGGTSASTVIQQHPNTGEIQQYAGAYGGLVALGTTSFGIIASVFDDTSSTIQLNNGTAQTGTPGTNNAGGLTIGAQASGAFASNVDVAEVIAYSGAKSAGEITRVNAYLAAKWGITL